MLTRTFGKVDYLERLSRLATLAFFALAGITCVLAPLLALSFTNKPFPGFLVVQTLVVTTDTGQGWTGSEAGIYYPQHVVRVGGEAVVSVADFDAALSRHSIGQTVSVFVKFPDGSSRLYPSIVLTEFPATSMVPLFLLPYLVGLAYFGIAIWIYRLRGHARPGRALVFFCVCTSLTTCLLFDLASTHVASAVWTVAIAMAGGALISLGLRFPKEWRAVAGRPWVLALPYVVSALLAAWGLVVLYDTANPWAYEAAWEASYRYIALAMLFFIITMVTRASRSPSPVVRRQARVVLLGSFLAFAPLAVWFVLPLFGVIVPFNGLLLLPELVLFPLAVSAAILRYGLLEVDIIINRTIVYGTMTAILAGLFTISITLWQKIFVALTGEKSDAAVIIASLLVASAFEPLRTHLQGLVDRRFKQLPDNTRELRGFGEQVRASVEMRDANHLMRGLLEQAVQGLEAGSGAVSLTTPAGPRTVYTHGNWRGEATIMLPLECEGERYGLLALGPRNNRRQYTRQEYEALEAAAAQVSQALRLATAPGRPSEWLQSQSAQDTGRP